VLTLLAASLVAACHAPPPQTPPTRAIPMPVPLLVDVGGMDHCSINRTLNAVEWWNRVVGEAVFEPVPLGKYDGDFNRVATITSEGSPILPKEARLVGNQAGVTRLRAENGHLVAALVILREDVCELLGPIVAHELGHVLGLDHAPEDDVGRLMHPVTERAGMRVTREELENVRRGVVELGLATVADVLRLQHRSSFAPFPE